MTVGEYLEEQRRAVGKSVADVARETGVSKQAYYNWSGDIKSPSISVIKPLCDALIMDGEMILELLNLAAGLDITKPVGRQ